MRSPFLKRIDRVDRRLLEREGTRESTSRPPECAFHGSRTMSTKSRTPHPRRVGRDGSLFLTAASSNVQICQSKNSRIAGRSSKYITPSASSKAVLSAAFERSRDPSQSSLLFLSRLVITEITTRNKYSSNVQRSIQLNSLPIELKLGNDAPLRL